MAEGEEPTGESAPAESALGSKSKSGGPNTHVRRRLEHRLDALVSRHRFTIAIVFPVVGAISLVASAQGFLPDVLAFNPFFILFGVFVMRLPLVAGLGPLLDRRGGAIIAGLLAYTYAIEFVGVTTGLPYGEFSYGISLGPMIGGTIPYALPLFFLPLVLNSYLLTYLLLGDRATDWRVRLPVVAATVVAVDLVLDPAAVALGFWSFEAGGYYGVPLSNYGGWILSAILGTVAIDLAFSRRAIVDRLDSCEYLLDDMVSFVLLWGAINAYYRAWIPLGIALAFAGGLVYADRFDFDVRPWWLSRIQSE